jgi:hypothetical protein
MVHRFHEGQDVRLTGPIPTAMRPMASTRSLGSFTYCDRDVQYWIKSLREQHERVVKESEFEALATRSRREPSTESAVFRMGSNRR